ncbi:hypothetical protein [Spirosoma horti]
MKTFFFLGTAMLATATASAQNTTVVNQQGSNHEVTVVQEGIGNVSIVNQSNQASNRAVISQSGSGNSATINQGSQIGGGSGQSVSISQSGASETVVNQTDGSNSISVHQRSMPSVLPVDEPAKKSKRRDSTTGRKRK